MYSCLCAYTCALHICVHIATQSVIAMWVLILLTVKFCGHQVWDVEQDGSIKKMPKPASIRLDCRDDSGDHRPAYTNIYVGSSLLSAMWR